MVYRKTSVRATSIECSRKKEKKRPIKKFIDIVKRRTIANDNKRRAGIINVKIDPGSRERGRRVVALFGSRVRRSVQTRRAVIYTTFAKYSIARTKPPRWKRRGDRSAAVAACHVDCGEDADSKRYLDDAKNRVRRVSDTINRVELTYNERDATTTTTTTSEPDDFWTDGGCRFCASVDRGGETRKRSRIYRKNAVNVVETYGEERNTSHTHSHTLNVNILSCALLCEYIYI